jgi:hypothetical protein
MDSKICNTCGKLKPLNAFQVSFAGQNAKMGFNQNENRKHRCKACYGLRDRVRTKLTFLSMYGGKCVCCGQDEPRFLTLDHVNSDGSKHRQNLADNQIMANAVANYQPELYQILCYNCNCGRSANGGICPHKDKTKEEYLTWTDKLLESRAINPTPRIRLTPLQQLEQLAKGLSKEELEQILKKSS